MTAQPEALRLADVLDTTADFQMRAREAAAELRRLHALCEEMLSELYVYRASEYLKDVTAAIKARNKATGEQP